MSRPRSRERGIALLLVLWIFMILGVIALDFAQYMRDDAMAAVNLADETRGYYIALAGMNRVIYETERYRERHPSGQPAAPPVAAPGTQSQEDMEDDDEPTCQANGQPCEGEFWGGGWTVTMYDEAGRISLNRASRPVLSQVVKYLLQGGNKTTSMDRHASKAADVIPDSILDWRDANNDTRPNGAERKYYAKRGYGPANWDFSTPDELLRVRGVTPALYYGGDGMPGLRDVFSVYGVETQIHLPATTAPVLQVLLGVDADQAADMIAQRDGLPTTNGPGLGTNSTPTATPLNAQQLNAQLMTQGLPNLFVDGNVLPRVVRIEARGDTKEKRNQSHVEVIIDLAAESGEGTRIMYWLDRAPWDGPLPGDATAQNG